MALLWADGFDHYGTLANANQIYSHNVYDISQLHPRTGGWSAYFVTGNNKEFWRVFSPHRTMIVGAALYTDNPVAFGQQGFYIQSPAGKIFVYLVAGNKIRVTKGAVVLGESAVNTVTPASYTYVEAKVFNDVANGSIEIRINGNPVPVLLLVAQALWSSDFDTVGFCGNYSDGTFVAEPMWIDDFYVADTTTAFNNDFLGDVRARTFLPVTDGPAQAFVPTGGGSGFSQIDNVPYNAAQYVAGSNVGDTSNFGKTPLPTNTAYVAGINVFCTLRKSDAGVCEITPQILSSGSVGSGTPINPGTGDGIFTSIIQADPHTGTYFARLDFDAALMQIKRTA